MNTELLETIVESMKILDDEKEAEICQYYENGCKIKKQRVCFIGYSEHCAVKRFFDKYGRDYLKSAKLN